MLLHDMHKWLDVISVDLWPYALKLVADLHNATPGLSGQHQLRYLLGQRMKIDWRISIHLAALCFFWKFIFRQVTKFLSGSHALVWLYSLDIAHSMPQVFPWLWILKQGLSHHSITLFMMITLWPHRALRLKCSPLTGKASFRITWKIFFWITLFFGILMSWVLNGRLLAYGTLGYSY